MRWTNVHWPWRRAVALAGAVTVLGGVTLILAGCQSAHPAAAPSSHRPTLSVGPVAVGPVAVGTGTVGRRPWQVTVDSKDGMLCAGVTGMRRSCVGLAGLTHVPDPASLSGTQVAVPGRFVTFGPPTWNSIFGTVGADVTRVSVRLSHGAPVSLTPVTAAGYRWIGMVLPLGVEIDKVIAYSHSSELAYSVPFYGGLLRPGIYFATWLSPGQDGPRQAERYIAAGGSGLSGWNALVVAGPWGYCVSLDVPAANGGEQNCLAVGFVRSGVQVVMHWGSAPAVPRWFIGTAEPAIAFLRLNLAAGGTVKVPVTEVSGQKFYAMEVRKGLAIVRWGAFTAAGRWLYGGSGAPDSGH
jgi:hypothetical protein